MTNDFDKVDRECEAASKAIDSGASDLRTVIDDLETEIRELRAAASRQQGAWEWVEKCAAEIGTLACDDEWTYISEIKRVIRKHSPTVAPLPEPVAFDMQSARQVAIESFRSDLANPLTGALNEIERLRAALAAKDKSMRNLHPLPDSQYEDE